MKIIEFLFLLSQRLLPKRKLSKTFGRIASSRNRLVSQLAREIFLLKYKIKLSEAQHDSIKNYPDLNSLFRRRLRPETRSQPNDPSIWTSPADGKLTQFGNVSQRTLLQAKGLDYSITQLLDSDIEISDRFQNGSYGCIYLAPHNYHRVHMPTDGTLYRARYVPGDLFSVNETTVKYVDRLFCRNERVILLFKKKEEYFAIILVGACLVGGIAVILPGKNKETSVEVPSVDWPRRDTFSPIPSEIPRGAEIGYFYFGSTVIFLTSKELTNSEHKPSNDVEVRVGDPLARCF